MGPALLVQKASLRRHFSPGGGSGHDQFQYADSKHSTDDIKALSASVVTLVDKIIFGSESGC